MEPVVTVEARPEHAGLRLDQFLPLALPGLSRHAAKDLLRRGGVSSARGRVREAAAPVTNGARYTLDLSALETRPPEVLARLEAKAHDLVLLEESRTWAAVQKPAGLGCLPKFFGDRWNFASFAAALLHDIEAGLPDGGLVHRLDHDTSGVSIITRTHGSHTRLVEERQRGELFRVYWALVAGRLAPRGSIDTPIAHLGDEKMTVVRHGAKHRGTPQPARTEFEVLAEADGKQLLAVRIHGGRRHQIRVHLASIGCPILGDRLYGVAAGERHALHATEAYLICPDTGQSRRVLADPGMHFWAFAPALERPAR